MANIHYKLPDYKPGEPGTLGRVFAEYMDYIHARVTRDEITAETARRYDTALRQLASVVIASHDPALPFGKYPVASLTLALVNMAVQNCHATFTAKSTNYALTIAGGAYAFALENEWAKGDNLFVNARRVRVRAAIRSKSWEPEEIRAIYDAATRINLPVVSLAFQLAELLVQRPSDIVGLRGHNYDRRTKVLSFTIKKTAEPVRVNLATYPAIAALFETLKPGQGWLYDAATDREITTPAQFRPLFRRVRKAAGVRDDLWFADMRRTKITMLGDAGLTAEQIRAITRHKHVGSLKPYLTMTQQGTDQMVGKLAGMSVAPVE